MSFPQWKDGGGGGGEGLGGRSPRILPTCMHTGSYIAAFFQTRSVSMATIEAVQR